MNEKLWADPDKCTGCGICELVCSFFREGQWTHALSRIKIIKEENNTGFYQLFCQQCDNPPCETACLMNIVKKDSLTGKVTRNVQGCIGCRACEVTCPLGGCFYNYEKEVVLNCDLCGGDPLCVKFCPEGALSYKDSTTETTQRREAVFKKNVHY